jgi:hypothetical protein
MSFYSTFIERIDEEARLWARESSSKSVMRVVDLNGKEYQKTADEVRDGLRPFVLITSYMRRAKIVRLRADQAQVFLDTPETDGQDYVKWLRLPFPALYLHIDGRMVFDEYAAGIDADIAFARSAGDVGEVDRLETIKREGNPDVKGVLLYEVPADQVGVFYQGRLELGLGFDEQGKPRPFRTQEPLAASDVARVICATFFIPVRDFLFNVHSANLLICKDGALRVSISAQQRVRDRIRAWTVHAINFLSSPTVKLVATEPAKALQQKRARSGKQPLPGWYEITWRRVIKEYTRDKISPKRWTHSYAYDVRGHPKTHTRGKMAGRVIWCPPHMRGIRNALYKPAVRILDKTGPGA